MHGRTKAGTIAALGCAAAVLFAAPASAEITSVFSETATPVDCEVLTGGDEGIRYCGSVDIDPGPATDMEPDRTTVATFDGVPIDVNVAFPPEPESDPDGPWPVVMLFHGYAGSKLGMGSMRRWLDQGYATFSMTTRGNGESCGTFPSQTAGGAACDDGYVHLMDTRYEVRDTQELVALLVDEGLVDAEKIGATGGSYGGGMSMALAALGQRKMLPDGASSSGRAQAARTSRSRQPRRRSPGQTSPTRSSPTAASSTTSPTPPTSRPTIASASPSAAGCSPFTRPACSRATTRPRRRPRRRPHRLAGPPGPRGRRVRRRCGRPGPRR